MSHVRNEEVVLLRRGTDPDKHIFFIHAATGEIGVYANFCSGLNEAFYCWGIKSGEFEGLAPKTFTVEQIAKKYVKKILRIKEEGSYYLAGWCIGGTIAFEMARQFEKMGEDVAFLGMFNSNFMKVEAERKYVSFGLESEKELLDEILPLDRIKGLVNKSTDTEELWRAIIEHAEKCDPGQEIVKGLKEAIPEGIRTTVPNYQNTDIQSLVYYINVMRTYVNPCAGYVPAAGIKTEISFFRASEETAMDVGLWEPYSEKPLRIHTFSGSHFYIFDEPYIYNNTKVFNNVIMSI